jgi:copper chaperone CopZ
VLLELAMVEMVEFAVVRLGRWAIQQAQQSVESRPEPPSQPPVASQRLHSVPRAAVVSCTPGRARISVVGLRGNGNLACAVQDLVLGLPGVQDVTANPVTGNILVVYDPRVISTDEISAAIDDAEAAGSAHRSANRRRALPATPV